MSNRIRCACRRCTIRSLMGPAVIITVGLLFLLDQMRGGFLSFGNTFPIILIVIGVVLLVAELFIPSHGVLTVLSLCAIAASTESHGSS